MNHFVDDATDNGVLPDTSPTVCSWITTPSPDTMRITPPESPAERTRVASNASVVSKVSEAKTFGTIVVVVTVVVVVEVGSEVDVDVGAVTGAVESLVVFVADEPQPTNSPHTTTANTCRDRTRRNRLSGANGEKLPVAGYALDTALADPREVGPGHFHADSVSDAGVAGQ